MTIVKPSGSLNPRRVPVSLPPRVPVTLALSITPRLQGTAAQLHEQWRPEHVLANSVNI